MEYEKIYQFHFFMQRSFIYTFAWFLTLAFLVLTVSSCQQTRYEVVGQSRSQSPVVAQEEEEFQKNAIILRKSNLEALAVGSNRIEIEELMGPPEGRSLDGGNGYLWDYRRAVLDEATGKLFRWSLVSFKFLKGRCAYVRIRLENPPTQLLDLENQGQKVTENPPAVENLVP